MPTLSITNEAFFPIIAPYLSTNELIKTWTRVSQFHRFFIDSLLFGRQDQHSVIYQLKYINRKVSHADFFLQPNTIAINTDNVVTMLGQSSLSLIDPNLDPTWLSEARLNGIKWLNQQLGLPVIVNSALLLSFYNNNLIIDFRFQKIKGIAFYAPYLSPMQLGLLLPALQTHLSVILNKGTINLEDMVAPLLTLVTYLSPVQLNVLLPLFERRLTAGWSFDKKTQVNIATVVAAMAQRIPVNMDLLLTRLIELLQCFDDEHVSAGAAKISQPLMQKLTMMVIKPHLTRLIDSVAIYLGHNHQVETRIPKHVLSILQLVVPYLNGDELNSLVMLLQQQLTKHKTLDYYESMRGLLGALMPHCSPMQLSQLFYALPLTKQLDVIKNPDANMQKILTGDVYVALASDVYQQWLDNNHARQWLDYLSHIGAYLLPEQAATISQQLIKRLLSANEKRVNATLITIVSFAKNRSPLLWPALLGAVQSLLTTIANQKRNDDQQWRTWSAIVVHSIDPLIHQQAGIFLRTMMQQRPFINEALSLASVAETVVCLAQDDQTAWFDNAYRQLTSKPNRLAFIVLTALVADLTNKQVNMLMIFLATYLARTEMNDPAFDLLIALTPRLTSEQIADLLEPLRNNMYGSRFSCVEEKTLCAFIALAPKLSTLQHEPFQYTLMQRLTHHRDMPWERYCWYVRQLAPYVALSKLKSLVDDIIEQLGSGSISTTDRDAALNTIDALASYWPVASRQRFIIGLLPLLTWRVTGEQAIAVLLTLFLSASDEELVLYRTMINKHDAGLDHTTARVRLLQLAIDNWLAIRTRDKTTSSTVTWETTCFEHMTLAQLTQTKEQIQALTPIPNRYFMLVNSQIDTFLHGNEPVNDISVYRSLLALLWATTTLPPDKQATVAAIAQWETTHQALLGQHPFLQLPSIHYRNSILNMQRASLKTRPTDVQSFAFLQCMTFSQLIDATTILQTTSNAANPYFALVSNELERLGRAGHNASELKVQKYRSLLELLYLTSKFSDDKTALLTTLKQWKKTHYQLMGQHDRQGFFSIHDTLSKRCVDQLMTLAMQEDRLLLSNPKASPSL